MPPAQALRHHRPALRQRQVPHRPHHGVHPGRHLGAAPANARARGALRLRRRRARRADHDRGREGRQDAAGSSWPSIAAGRKPYLDGFHIALRQLALAPTRRRTTSWRSRSTATCQGQRPDRRASAIEQFFDPVKGMFLPDRFIKGECPNCHAKDQYGDNCEVCGAVYSPTDLINPYSALSGATPVLQKLRALLLQAVRPALRRLPARTGPQRRPAAARGAQQDQRMARAGRRRQGRLGDWDISRDAPYFGIEIPDAPGKYFYVWLDAPVGYLASLKNYFDKIGVELRRASSPITRPWSSTTSSARTSSPSTRCSGRRCCIQRPQGAEQDLRARLPHGEQRREDEQEPRHRLDPLKYLSLGMNPEWLRYYLAAKLNAATRTSTSTPKTSWRASTAT